MEFCVSHELFLPPHITGMHIFLFIFLSSTISLVKEAKQKVGENVWLIEALRQERNHLWACGEE